MAKIQVKTFMDGAIKYGPKVGKFIAENADKVEPAVKIMKDATKAIIHKKDPENVHYRKDRHVFYKKEILNIEQKNRTELVDYRTEINQFIEQIKAEQAKELAVKKPMHSKRTKNWEALLVQIEDKINLKDFQEYLRIYNSPAYESVYFNGFKTTISKFKCMIEKGNVEEVHDFVIANTTIPEETVKKNFI